MSISLEVKNMLKIFMRALETGVALVVLCGGFTACASHDELSPPPRRAITTQAADLNAEQAARVVRARQKARWVGESHHAAMMVIYEDALSRRREKKPTPKAWSADYCRLMIRVGKTALRELDKARPNARTPQEQMAQIRTVPELQRCFDDPGNGVATNHLQLATAQITEDLEPEVSGAYEGYLDLMESHIRSTDWSVAAVRSAVNDVLATAAADGIPEGDLLALASFADFSESSANEWHSYDWNSLIGSGSTCSGDRCLTSFFRRTSLRGNVGKVISADVAGCLSSVKSWSALKVLLYLPAWKALAGECGVRGAIGSGIAIVALM